MIVAICQIRRLADVLAAARALHVTSAPWSRPTSKSGSIARAAPIGQSQITWMDIPHFHRRDQLIVLYLGHNADVLRPFRLSSGSHSPPADSPSSGVRGAVRATGRQPGFPI